MILYCRICLHSSNTIYHATCLQELFSQTELPRLDVDLAEVPLDGWKMAGLMSISGVQPKVSLRLADDGKVLRAIAKQGQFILKPQTTAFRALPENEHVTMRLAHEVGIDIPPCGLLSLRDGTTGYVVRRYDRTLAGGSKTNQEDFCQLAGLRPDDKYAGSAELCVRLVRKYTTNPDAEVLKLFQQVLFSYWCSNGDLHLKNFSLLREPSAAIRLTPAYDLVATSLVLPADDQALSVVGKRSRLRRGDWLRFAEYAKISAVAAEEFMERLKRFRMVTSPAAV